MKKLLYFSAILMVGAALSCTKETDSSPKKQVSFDFTTSAPDTKTVFGDKSNKKYPVLWENGDEVGISLNVKDAGSQTVQVSTSDGGRTASFRAVFDEAAPYHFMLMYPAVSIKELDHSSKTFYADIPSVQASTAGGPDPKAQLLYAMASYASTEAIPHPVSLTFHHFTGYLHITLKNVVIPEGNTLQSVTITGGDNCFLAGRNTLDASLETPAFNDNTSRATKSITVTGATYNEDALSFWCAVRPGDFSGKELSFEIDTDKKFLDRTITLGSDLVLSPGGVASFSVNMDGEDWENPVEFDLVDSADDLHWGDKIIIAAAETSADDADNNYALSTTQNGNNRSVTGINRVGNKILNPSSSVEIIELRDGFIPGTFALYATGNPGNLYAAGPSGTTTNALKTKSALDKKGSWRFDFGPNSNNAGDDSWHMKESLAIIKAEESDNNRPYIRYNSTDKLFASYVKNTSISPVRIYRKDVPADETPRFNVTDTEGNVPSDKIFNYEAHSLQIYVFGNVAWNAGVTGGGSLDLTSGTGPATLTLTIPENPDPVNPRDITVTVSTVAEVGTKSYQFTITQGHKPAFPIVWSMPAISDSWKDNVDFHCEHAYSWIYSDTHEGRLSINRFGTAPSNAPNYKYFASPTDTEVLVNGRLYSCGVYEGDYWLFEVFNVKNPAGIYSISYKTCSTNAGPRVFLLQYSVDDGANWVNINATTSALELKNGTSYDGGKEYTYTYTTSSAPDYANNEIKTVNEEFHIGAITETITLKIRAIVACKMKNDGSGNMTNNHHGGAHRVGENVTINFTADE